MTENNAAQQEAAIQEAERNAAAEKYFATRTWIMDTNDNRRIFEAGFDRAYALLPKLRAEGVQAGDDVQLPAPDATIETIPYWDAGHMKMYARNAVRAALASAHAAGEAHPVAWHCNEVGVTDIAHVAQGWREELGFTVRPLVFGDAAPQASEAVRNEALYLLREARGLLPAFATAEAIGAWSEKVNRFAAGDVIDIPPQADKDGGDCAKGAGDQPDIETLRRVGAAHDAVQVCPECDIAGCKHIRAALSPTQPTGGRDEA